MSNGYPKYSIDSGSDNYNPYVGRSNSYQDMTNNNGVNYNSMNRRMNDNRSSNNSNLLVDVPKVIDDSVNDSVVRLSQSPRKKDTATNDRICNSNFGDGIDDDDDYDLEETPNKTAENLTQQKRNQLQKLQQKVEKTKILNEVTEESLEFEEQQILRELLYALQGMDGKRIRFEKESNNSIYKEDSKSEIEKRNSYQGIQIQSPALQLGSIITCQRLEKSRLGTGAIDAVRICVEAGWYYQRISSYVHRILDNNTTSMLTKPGVFPSVAEGGYVARAFAGELQKELQEYHKLLAIDFESKLHILTLRQFMVRIRKPTLRLETLAMLTDAVSGGGQRNEKKNENRTPLLLTGSNLLAALHLHSNHGDTRHQQIVQSLLYAASRPWFNLLYLWTTQGILSDPFNEFFIVDDKIHNDNSNEFYNYNSSQGPTNKHMWQERYHIDHNRIPSGIIDPTLVESAFVVGKGINFIRKCFHDGEWTMELLEPPENQQQQSDNDDNSIDTGTNKTSENNNPLIGGTTDNDKEFQTQIQLGYHYMPLRSQRESQSSSLRKTLEKIANLVHTHILQSLREEHSLLSHLFALKQFLFHGQGDFISALMDGLYSEFGGPNNRRRYAAGIYKHNLLAIMDAAIRSTNAKNLPPFVLERLNVELLPMNDDTNEETSNYDKKNSIDTVSDEQQQSSMKRNTVWDIFMLDYTVPDPLVAIIHPKAMGQYKLVYSFLFGLRKVEFMLNFTWRQSATLQHALQTAAQYNGIAVSTNTGYAQAVVLLRKISMTRQSMMHFVVNMKSYLMYEVLEGGWKDLVRKLQISKTLDEAILAHDQYLESICRKSLLRSSYLSDNDNISNASVSGNKGEQQRLTLAEHFSMILNIASEFCSLQEQLFDDALLAADIAAQKRHAAEQRLKEGQWGFDNEQEVAEEESFFGLADNEKLIEVIQLAEAFNECMYTLLRALNAKVHGGTSSNNARNNSNNAAANSNASATTNATVPSDASTAANDETTPQDVHGTTPTASGLKTTPVSHHRFGSTDGDENNAIVDHNYSISEQDDLDSLRFLTFQLDHNNYYGLLSMR